MNDSHIDKHEAIILSIEKLTVAINALAQRLEQNQQSIQDTRNQLDAAMKTIGYEYSQDAKRWVKEEKLAELRKRD